MRTNRCGSPKFERRPVTAWPVDFEHWQIALRGGTLTRGVNGMDMQQHTRDLI